jgi:heme-degrading monooxygenase HmoA
VVLNDGIAYEVTIELDDRHRDRFEEWFPNVVLDWGTQPDVRAFRVYRGVDDDGERVRFVFTFEEESAWERFVQRSAHRERMTRLESLTVDVRTALWATGAVRLHGDGPVIADAEDELGAIEGDGSGWTSGIDSAGKSDPEMARIELDLDG